MKGLLVNCIYGVLYLLSLLPMRIHYLFSDFFYLLVYYVVRYRVKLVRKNLADSFPEKSAEELRKTEKAFYHWFCDYVVETIKLISISKKELQRRMVFKGVEVIDEMIENGQSCAMYLGHYCNWEWVTSLPFWLSPKAQCGQIYHPLENMEFDKLFLKLRQRMGAVCISMNDTLREILRYHNEHQPVVIGYISDQVPHWRNIHHWCDFLNHDTPVLTGTERIARKMNHAVFYLEMCRVRRGYYEAEVKLITRNPQSLPEYEVTTRYFKMLEKTIQRKPEFWLWSHNRWKRGRAEFNEKFEIINGKVVPKGEEAIRLHKLEEEGRRKRK